jgi:DNA-binding IclR family transcriptional regulator
MVGSVDRALRLIQMLRDHGQLRLKAAAEELDVAESTVHRLMATLVFHGFAIQDDSRAYLPGMALGVGPAGLAWTRQVRDVATPHLEQLSKRTGETVNLVVLVGTNIHFLSSYEGNKALRIVSRSGAVMPARLSAGGRSLLAELSEEHLRHLYQGPAAESHGEEIAESEFVLFQRELRLHQRNGFATANQEIEDGVAAMAMPVRGPAGSAVAAFSVSAPAARSADLFSRVTMHLALVAKEAIEADIVNRVVRGADPSARAADPVRSPPM